MADANRGGGKQLPLKHSNAPKRGHSEIDSSSSNDDFLHSLFSDDQQNSPVSPKKLRTAYREQRSDTLDIESLSQDSGTLHSLSFSNLSSPTTSLKNSSLPSLELNSIIQKYDMATLNSLSMSQMSAYSEDARSSPFPQTVEMSSQSSMASLDLQSLFEKGDDDGRINSLTCSQTSMMSFTEGDLVIPVPQFSPPTQSSSINSEESWSSGKKSATGLLDAQSTNQPSNILNNSGQINDNSVNHTVLTSFTLPEPKPQDSQCVVPIGKTTMKIVEEQHKTPSQEKKTCEEKIQDNVDSCKSSKKKEELHSKQDENKTKDTSTKYTNDSENKTSARQEGNPELKEDYKSCKKNPGHEKFFPPKDLKVSNLPKDIQHEDTVTFFQCLSKLVIQISVGSTSPNRSKHDSYSSYIGTKNVRNGSGFIVSTDKHIMKVKCTKKDCPNNDQGNSCSPSETSGFNRSLSNMSTTSTESSCSSTSNNKHYCYGGVFIKTNRHVIFDQSEADDACVNFFFESSDRKKVIQGHVASINGVNNEQDNILLYVMSHNRNLLDAIGLYLADAKSSYVQMIKSTHNSQQNHGCGKLCWVAVLSHPHGTAISVSFGRLKKEERQMKRVIKYYDAATCPGSSGGLVITPTLLSLQWPGAVHSSHCELTKFNVSLDSRFHELDASVIGQMNKNILNKKDSVIENQYKL